MIKELADESKRGACLPNANRCHYDASVANERGESEQTPLLRPPVA